MSSSPKTPALGPVKLGILLLSILLALNTYLSVRSTQALSHSSEWVAHTLAVETEIETIGSLVKDVETGQRGFLLTGKDNYLDPYTNGVHELPAHVARFSRLTGDNPNQVENLAELRTLIDQRIRICATSIDLYRQGRQSESLNVVNNNNGKEIMDRIRVLLSQMRSEEQHLLEAREFARHRTTIVAFWTLGISAVIAIGALLLFGNAISREMRARAEAAGAIREREEWLETTIRSIGDAVIATDAEGKVKFLNPVAESLIDLPAPKLHGLNILEALPLFNEVTGAPAENPVEKVMRTGLVVGMANHTVLRRHDGSQVPIDDSAAPITDDKGNLLGVVMVFRDVSEQRKVELAMRTTEKLAAAGRLSATIAHEVNNPLEAVTNILFLLRGEAGLSPEGRSLLATADEQLARVTHVTKQTLAFYKDSSLPESIELGELCDRVLELYRTKAQAKNIVINKNYAEGIAVVAAPGDLIQIFSNLISNAIDAMGDAGELTINLSTNTDETAIISISDDGCGIPQQNLEKVFEPFFTTKKEVGTGLGLWITRGIIERIGGAIRITSNGQRSGTRFEVTLPDASTGSGASA